MILDLTQGFGDFPEYKLFKFPDGSIKFELKKDIEFRVSTGNMIVVKTTLRSNDDLFVLALVKSVIKRRYVNVNTILRIDYMMYQQDDRLFDDNESFGLKVVCDFINTMQWDRVQIFHPHSDKVEFIDNCEIIDNRAFIKDVMSNHDRTNTHWIIPDAGAFKTQFKQLTKMDYPNFVTCMKSRDHVTGDISTVVNTTDLEGKDCIIFDDICLGGNTFIQIAQELRKKNCGKLYLAVSHGVFNKGIEHLYEYFDRIYTTDSICSLESSDKLRITMI